MSLLKRLFLGLLTLIFSVSLFANEDLLERYKQKNEPMPIHGKFAGETIESKEKRTLILLSETEKSIFGIDTEDLAFANFRHKGEFYIASIPAIKVNAKQNLKRATKVVKSVTFMKEHWSGKSRPETKSVEVHSELLFDLTNTSGIKLIFNQDQRKDVIGDIRIYGAVMSIEAIRSNQNPDADFMPAGLGYNFAVGYRLYSYAERDLKNQKEEAAEYTTYALDFSNTESFSAKANSMDYLLFKSIKTSHNNGRRQTYNLFQNNCTNRLFDLLDISMGYNKNSGGEVSFEAIGDEYLEFINNDLEDITGFLAQLVKDQVVELPIEIESQLYGLSRQLMLENLNEMRQVYGRRGNAKNFLYALPPFIEGHLKARGLVK